MGKVIAFIPARGGSKSIPLKNIKLFCGKPLIYWNLKAIEDSSTIDEVIVATDHETIASTINSFNFKKTKIYNRDPQNAQDTSSTESVMIEYIEKSGLSPDSLFILVQLTSPFTRSEHFENAITNLRASNADSLLTCVRNKRFFWNPEGQAINYNYQNRPRRQDFEGMLMENGAFYINTVQNILTSRNRLSGKIIPFEMPEYTAVEIDEEEDWIIAESLMKRYNLNQKTLTPEIKLVITDVDGVLTDAGMYYSENGDELKKFNTRDGMGFELLRAANIKTGIITSENTQIVSNRAKKLKVDYLYQGKISGGKLSSAIEICKKEGIALSNVAYIGDDINCFDLLQSVGKAFCPSDAVGKIKYIENICILNSRGGQGAFREAVELLLANKNEG